MPHKWCYVPLQKSVYIAATSSRKLWRLERTQFTNNEVFETVVNLVVQGK